MKQDIVGDVRILLDMVTYFNLTNFRVARINGDGWVWYDGGSQTEVPADYANIIGCLKANYSNTTVVI